MLGRVASSGLFVLLAGAVAPEVLAAEAADAKETAKQHFREGQKLYNLGQFDRAVDEFSAAYTAHPLPAFLFNLGQCEKQRKDYERAIFFFERFLKEEPDAATASTVREVLEETRKELKRELRRDAEEKAAVVPPPQLVAPAAGIAPLAAVYEQGWFWSLVASGAVLLGGSLYIAFNTGGETVHRPPEGSLGVIDRR